jgi:branched-chain amino acid transport system permease protein
MNLVTLFQFVVNGLVLGSIYVLVAMGLSIIFGMIGVVNFAHGVLYMLGAYATVAVTQHFGFFPSLVISPFLIGLLGMSIEALFLRRLYKEDPALGLLFTFGLALFLEQMVRLIWGTQGLPFDIPEQLKGVWTFGPIVYSKYRYFILVCAIAVVAGLWAFLEKTTLGMIIRAGSRDPDMVRMTAIGGVLTAPMAGVEPAMGTNLGTAAFVVVVIGGLGSFWGSVLAGVLVGEVVSLSILFWPPMAEASMFALMVVVLLARPRGLLGQRWERFE